MTRNNRFKALQDEGFFFTVRQIIKRGNIHQTSALNRKRETFYYLLGNVTFIEIDHTKVVAKMTRV